jgi:hypothetical protein
VLSFCLHAVLVHPRRLCSLAFINKAASCPAYGNGRGGIGAAGEARRGGRVRRRASGSGGSFLTIGGTVT